MMARGVVAMCTASSSSEAVTIARLAGVGSPSGPDLETKPTNGTSDLLAMGFKEKGCAKAVVEVETWSWR